MPKTFTDPQMAVKALREEIGKDFQGFVDQLYKEVKQQTPIDQGTARQGWKKHKVAKNRLDGTILTNSVQYVQYLDKGSSKQAPDGIIQPAIEKTLSKHNKRKP